MQTKHRNHDWCDIEDISEGKQKELEKNINILEKETLPKLKEKKKKADEGENIDKDEIDRQTNAMITLIKKYGEHLKSKVDSTRASNRGTGDIKASLDQDIVAIEQVIRNSKKSIAIQAKSEIVQGNENVKVVIKEVDKSLAEMDRGTVTCFRCGKIDTHVLQRMFGDVESEHDMTSDFDDMSIAKPLKDVSIKVKNTFIVGKRVVHLCSVGNRAWINMQEEGNAVLMDANGRTVITREKVQPQDLCCDKTGNLYICHFDGGWISRLTPDQHVKDIVNTMPLRPFSLCITQSGDILVALVDVSIADFKKCKQTYIARLDNIGREKQRIQFEEDGKTRLFQYTTYVVENKNNDIVVLDHIGKYQGRLYILNDKGAIKHSYSGTSQLDAIFNSYSVCCDDQCRIIVADMDNSAFHLLNPRGDLLQLLMTEKDGLVLPYSVGLCDGLLWIGTREGKVIVAEYNA